MGGEALGEGMLAGVEHAAKPTRRTSRIGTPDR